MPPPQLQQSRPDAGEGHASSALSSLQLKAALRGLPYEQQVQMLSPGPEGDAMRADVQTKAQAGLRGGGGPLPHREAIQKSFGSYDVSNVIAHTGPQAESASESIGATAYATGNHVVFGQGGDSLHTAAHEAAHVIQQRAGVALKGGVGQSGDVYEQHADQVADLVVQGKSAEGLLGEVVGSDGSTAALQQVAVQRKAEPESPDDYFEDVGPVPSVCSLPDVDEDIQDIEGCGRFDELKALQTRVQRISQMITPLASAVMSDAKTSLTKASKTLNKTHGRLGEWCTQERRILTRKYADLLASQGSSMAADAGDITGHIAALNILNPEPVSKLVIGAILIVVGAAVRDYGRDASERALVVRQRMLSAGLAAPSDALTEAMGMGAAGLTNALLAGALQTQAFAWSAGYLEGQQMLVGNVFMNANEMCSNPDATQGLVAGFVKNATIFADILDELIVAACVNRDELQALPNAMSARADAVFDLAVQLYIQWMGQSGPIRVAGQLEVDRQSGGDGMRFDWQRTDGVGSEAAANMGPTTLGVIRSGVASLLQDGLLYDLDAKVTVHTYEDAHGSGAYDQPTQSEERPPRGRPITLHEDARFRVSGSGAVENGQPSRVGRHVSGERLHAVFSKG